MEVMVVMMEMMMVVTMMVVMVMMEMMVVTGWGKRKRVVVKIYWGRCGPTVGQVWNKTVGRCGAAVGRQMWGK